MGVPYRWVIVAAGGLMGCVAIGSMFSLPVFLAPIAQATGWSRTGLSTAMTINFLPLAVAGFGWGILVDRFGPRPVVLSGAVLLGLGIALASRSRSLLEFQLVYGVLVGAGAGAIFAPLMATVTGWFDTQRSLAVSLVSAGMGIAPMTVAPLAARLVSIYDWRTSQLLIAILAWAVLLPAALLVRRPPAIAARVGVVYGDRRHDRGGGASLAAIRRARADVFLLLRNAFGADFPHHQLRHELRRACHGGRLDLQCRGSRRTWRPRAVRRPGRQARGQAGSDRRIAGAGVGCRGLFLRARDLERSTRSRRCSG